MSKFRESRRNVGEGAQEYGSGLLLDRAIDMLLSRVEINRTYHVPYLAGYSTDAHRIYIDRELPTSLKVGTKTIDPTKYLATHEATEKAIEMLYRMPYHPSHQIALQLERALVQADGVNWVAYNRALDPYIREDYKEQPLRLPPDLDLEPYRDEHDAALLKKMQESQSAPRT